MCILCTVCTVYGRMQINLTEAKYLVLSNFVFEETEQKNEHRETGMSVGMHSIWQRIFEYVASENK